MAEWCMAHPWMTFWLIVIALLIADSMFANWRNTKSRSFSDYDR